MHHTLAGLVLAFFIGTAPVAAQTLRIYQIDVEQADSALLVMPNGRTLLIDSGSNGAGGRIRNVMAMAGVTQIDAYVTTHYHEDHFGGIDDLVALGVPVIDSYDRGDKACCLSKEKKNQKTFKDYQRAVGEAAHPLRAGDTIDLDLLVTITTIASGGDVLGERNPVLGRDENDMSVALLISFAGFTAFYGGDLEAPTESRIAASDLVLDVDLYKADHHGSDTSSSARFMADLSPSLILISNGTDDGYKHPRAATLATFARLQPNPTVIQTNKCFRALPCANVPDDYIADPEAVDDDGTIVVTVDAESGTYTAQYATTTLAFAVKAPVAAAP